MVELKRGGVSSMNSWEIFFLSNLLKGCLSFVCDCDLFGWVVVSSHSEEIKYTADNSLSIGEAG